MTIKKQHLQRKRDKGASMLEKDSACNTVKIPLYKYFERSS